MQRQLGATPDLQQGEVVHLAHSRDRDRGGGRAFADAGVVERLDVDDDVAAGQRLLDRGLDRVCGGVPLADGGRRGDADHDVCELPAAGLAHP